MERNFIFAEAVEGIDGVYSLRLVCADGEVRMVNDFTSYRLFAESVCESINLGEVSKHHIDDIIEDILP